MDAAVDVGQGVAPIHTYRCSGFLTTDAKLLTAAHCVEGADTVIVGHGSRDITDEDYLIRLARGHLSARRDRDSSHESGRRLTEARIAELTREKTHIVRALARQDELDALGDALAEVNHEIAALTAELHETARRDDPPIDATTVESQLTELAAAARTRLENASPETIAALYDLLELDLVRTGSARFEGTGVIPIPESGGEIWNTEPAPGAYREGGEVWKGTLQRPLLHRGEIPDYRDHMG